MFPFYTVVSIIPLALYVGIIAVINRRKTPQVVSRTTDSLWLALGLSGFFFIGPAQLLVPVNALVDKHALAWILIMFLYFLLAGFSGSLFRPRCTIYNISYEQAQELLNRAIERVGGTGQWLESSVFVSGLNFQILVEPTSCFRAVSLQVLSPRVNHQDWHLFLETLAQESAEFPVHSRMVARLFFGLATLLSATAAFFIVTFPAEMTNGLILLFFP